MKVYIPTCKYFDVWTQQWSDNGCITLNYTQDTIWCNCIHFTSFVSMTESFKLQMNLTKTHDIWNVTVNNIFWEYPTACITLACLYFIILLLWCWLPRQDDRPLLARSDVLRSKLCRSQAIERWEMKRLVRVLDSEMNLIWKLLH